MEKQPQSENDRGVEDLLMEVGKDARRIQDKFVLVEIERKIPLGGIFLNLEVMRQLIIWERKSLATYHSGERLMLERAEEILIGYRLSVGDALFLRSSLEYKGLRMITCQEEDYIYHFAASMIYQEAGNNLVNSLNLNKKPKNIWERISSLPRNLFSRFKR